MCSKTLFKTPAESLKPNHHPAAPTHRWMELHAHIKPQSQGATAAQPDDPDFRTL